MGQYVKCQTISITINVCSFYHKICMQKQLMYSVNVCTFLSNRIMPLGYLWGTCLWPLSNAMMTFPNAERLSDTLSGSLDLEELPRSIRCSRLLPPATENRKFTVELLCLN